MHIEPPIRVACIYVRKGFPDMASMDGIRFLRMAEAFARRGYEVDIVRDRLTQPEQIGPGLREVPFRFVRWDDYDLIKTSFHAGFKLLISIGGGDHPFIVSKLGSVVSHEETKGVHFFGAGRQRLFEIQKEIAKRSRVVTVLTNQSAALWRQEHGIGTQLLQVPTGVDAKIPEPGANPYLSVGITEPVAIFAGNIYHDRDQPEVNCLWQDRLNRVGKLLKLRGVRLVVIGSGTRNLLDSEAVTHLGRIEGLGIWDWLRYAKVGLVLAQGPVQDNESSKIYYYLRAGLPVVCERSVPNAGLIETTKMGTLVDYNDVAAIAEGAARLVFSPPPDGGVANYMARYHSWDARAAAYEWLFAEAHELRILRNPIGMNPRLA